MRIDDHHFGLIQIAFASERIKSDRCSAMIVFDAVEVSLQKFTKGDLTALCDVNQPAELFNEQIDAIGLESLFSQRMTGSKVLPKIINGFANFAERNLGMPSNR